MSPRPWDRLPVVTLPQGGRLSAFDDAVDRFFAGHLRGRPAADRTFYLASALGDHGILWMGLAAVAAARRARRRAPHLGGGLGTSGVAYDACGTQSGRRPVARDGQDAWLRPLARTVIGLTAESVLVNGPVKLVFRRQRPTHDTVRPLPLRQPRTSSFPSGHATAAFCAAALLRDDDPLWPLYYLLAVIVAFSRVHVRIHHGSDVVGGIATGIVLGEVIRRGFPVVGTPAAPPTLMPA